MPRVELIVKEPPKFFPSGSTQLDLINGGGWAISRTINIIGDQSCGKSLLAIEACANFGRLFGTENIKYNESENAFDVDYAETIGLPKGLDFANSATAEEFHRDLIEFLEPRKGKGPCLYIQDSWDALSCEDELEKDIGEATYGTGKAKVLHEVFRRDAKLLEETLCTLMIISQTKDKIGVTFGETKTRSGGRALDFYPSQIVWLSHRSQIKHTFSGVERVTGVQILARNKKNKIGKPFGQAEFNILFNYGIDDEFSNIEWLLKNKLGIGSNCLSHSITEYKKLIENARDDRDRRVLQELGGELKEAVYKRWKQIDDAFQPSMRKYE